MRRVLIVFAVALVAAGGSLLYVGTRDAGHRQVEHLPRLPTTTATVLLPEGTWTFGTGPAGVAVGRMHISGGPRLRNGAEPDSPVAGAVEVHHPGDPKVLLSVGVDTTGSFRIELPPGTYRLVARPTLRISPFQTHDFTIDAGHTTPVDLVAIAT